MNTASPLTKSEEVELITRWQRNRDHRARDQILQRNVGFIRMMAARCAKKYPNCPPIEDLEQEGAIGLLRALDTFDPTRGFRFITYAVHWIRYFTQIYIIKNMNSGFVCPGKHHRPGVAPIPVSISDPIGRQERSKTLEDALADSIDSVDEIMIAESDRDQVRDALTHLGDRERKILKSRYYEDRTLSDIGDDYGIGRESVRRVELNALARMKKILTSRSGAVDVDASA